MTLLIPALAALAQLPAEPPRDWAATLRTDAAALHDDIVANHPGMVNAADRDFARREAAAYRTLLARAGQVRDHAGYRFALSGYAASFDDGHVAAYPAKGAPVLPAQWPGFLTGFDADGAQRVRTRADDAPVPLGARLVACDGRDAARLARENIGGFDGRWSLASFRALRGGRLFADQGNPFIARPTRCTFDVQGTRRTIRLAWRPIADDALRARLADTNQRVKEPIGARRLADGTRWYTLSGFNGDPRSADAKALAPLIAAMRAERADLAAAPRIVLDLRGNGGGSSDWSLQIAQILWGEAAVAALPDEGYVEWRASPAVLAAMEEYLAKFDAAPDTTPRMRGYFRTAVDGMRKAGVTGAALWREPPEPKDDTGALAAVRPLDVPIYFVTDIGCGSACLDAVDLWRALGAVQVGQETAADTFYMDVRMPTLPSGLTGAAVPMKVYRGRRRGSNQPVAPDYPYKGDLRDTPALAAWIATLPPRRP